MGDGVGRMVCGYSVGGECVGCRGWCRWDGMGTIPWGMMM